MARLSRWNIEKEAVLLNTLPAKPPRSSTSRHKPKDTFRESCLPEKGFLLASGSVITPSMPDVKADLEYLADIPLYATEKPYLCLLSPSDGFDPETDRADNLEYEIHHGITITDMRDRADITIASHGFQILNHTSEFPDLESVRDVDSYKRETEQLLQESLGAAYVCCYDLRKRRNQVFDRTQFDVYDPLMEEGPAKGAHNGKYSTL
jgi:hypothetical protein